MVKCCMEPNRDTRRHFEHTWRNSGRSVVGSRTFNTYVDIGVAVQIDVDVTMLLPQTPVEFAQQMLDSTNAALQLQTSEFSKWANMGPVTMSTMYGQPLPVTTAVHNFLHAPIAASPHVRFILKKVVVNPANTNGVVKPFSNESVSQLKRGRLPRIPELLNIWVTTLTDSILGFATFPFDPVVPEFGVVVALDSTDPRFGGNPDYSLNRTLVHELGHLAGLFHTFTDPTSRVPPISSLAVPLSEAGYNTQDVLGDGAEMTPPQAYPTHGDPLNHWSQSNEVYNEDEEVVCFVNQMDYTADPAMLMLTADQVARFEYFLHSDVLQAGLVTDFVVTGATSWTALSPVREEPQLIILNKMADTEEETPGISGSAIAGIVVGVLMLVIIVTLTVVITRPEMNGLNQTEKKKKKNYSPENVFQNLSSTMQ
jgi:hypothetical protein